MSTVLTANTITVYDVRQIFNQCILPKNGSLPNDGTQINYRPREVPKRDVKEHEEFCVDFCHSLYEIVTKPQFDVREIDAIFSSALKCCVIMDDRLSEDEVVKQAHSILCRLPQSSLELLDIPLDIDSRYFSKGDTCMSGYVWENLIVSKWLCVSNIQFAIYWVINPEVTEDTDHYVNEFARMFQIASRIVANTKSTTEIHGWFVVRATIRSTWHRAVTLCLYFDLCKNLNHGFDGEDLLKYCLQDPSLALGPPMRKQYEHVVQRNKVQAMCSWIFTFLLRDSISLGMDFRTFHTRYQHL